MAKDISFSTVKHGMNKSDHIDFIKNHEYTHAKNSNLYNLQEGGLMLQSEASNLLTADFGEYKVIGVRNVYALNKTLYFLHNPITGNSKISLVSNKEIEEDRYDEIKECGDCKTISILDTPLERITQTPDREEEVFIEDSCNKCLNFSLENPIKSIVIKEESTGISAYFTDANNEQRVVNLSRKDWYKDNSNIVCGEGEPSPDECLDCDKLRLHIQHSPIIAKAKSLQGSGNLKRGTYQAFIAYVNKEGVELSEYQAITHPVPVFDSQNRVLTQKELIEDKTNTAIKIEIESIDEAMDYYKVIVVKRNNEGFKYYEEGVFNTRNKEVILTTEENKNLVDKSIIYLNIPKIIRSGVMAESNNMLVQGNVEVQADWNLQPVVNFIGTMANWITTEATEKLYADGINSANRKTALRDETYAKSIRFLTDTGYISPLYPLIGRPAYAEELFDKDKSSVEYKSVQQGNTTCDLTGRDAVWQYENTAEDLGLAESFEGSGIFAPRKLEYFCQVFGIPAMDEGAIRIILENYEDQKFLGLASFINTNRKYILSYEGDDEGILGIKALLLRNYGHCEPEGLLDTCEAIEEENLVMEDVKIANILNEISKFIETPFSLKYAKSDPPRYADLYFVDSEGNEVEDTAFRDTFIHYGGPVGQRHWYRKSMQDNWQLPKREIHTNNFTCVNSDNLPYYETSVRGEDQSYLMNHNVEMGIEEEPASTVGNAKATIGADQVNFLVFKMTRRGDSTSLTLKDNVHNINIEVSGTLIGEKQLNTNSSNTNGATYYIDQDNAYNTNEALGGEGVINVMNVDEENGRASGTFRFTANRYKKTITGDIDLDGSGNPIIESKAIESGAFNGIAYVELAETSEGEDHYPATLDPLLDRSRSYDNILSSPGYINYKLKLRMGNKGLGKPFGDTRFYKDFHDKSLWFKVDIPEEEEDIIIELTKTNDKTCEMRSKQDDFVGAVSLNLFRVSFWETCDSEKPFFTTIINRPRDESGTLKYTDIDPELQRNEGLMERVVTSKKRAAFLISDGMTQTELTKYDRSVNSNGDNLLEGKKFFYVTVEAPIFATAFQDRFMLAPSCQAFSIVTRAIEYGIVDVSFEGITVDKTESYLTNCTIEMPSPEDCNPQNYKYGEFGYVQSNRLYPDNQELYNSTNLKIRPSDILNAEHRIKFEGLYTNGLDIEGKYRMNSEANFSCKNIRHFKYPDNYYAPFLFNVSLAEFSDASIYPLAFTIDEETIDNFLNIAVKNKLITQKERDSIVGYEIFTGSREGNKSIQAKGILFDSYSYKVREKTVQFSNFPYNDLGTNNLFLDKDNKGIEHPFGGDSNNNFMFMSPDIYNKGGVWASEMSIDSYQFGSSTTTFPEVKDHPKWIILGKKAYEIADILSWTETVVDITLQLLEGIEAFRISVGTSSGFNIPGIILHVAATALTLTQNLFIKRGSYKLQWLNTIRDLGTPYNFAHRASGVGKYNYLMENKMPDNKLRGLTSREMLGEGLNTITDRIGRIHYVNNIDREKSMHITLGMDKEPDIIGQEESYALEYPPSYKGFDNSDLLYGKSSRFSLGEVDKKGGPDIEVIRNIASPYATLKNYVPEQYGEIDSIKWLPTPYYGDLRNKKKQPTIYAGDSFISRFAEIRKIPMYLVDAMNQSSLTTFEYKKNRNIGERTKFYVDYEVSGEEKLKSIVLPEIRSNYVLDCLEGSEGFYLKPPSKFYLQYYGIVDYLIESDINANYRYAKEGIENSFFPQERDHVRLTEETLRPIRTPNTLYYDRTYNANPIRTAINVLFSNYDGELEKIKAKGEGLMMQSEVDNNEFSTTDPWSIYKPNNYFLAPTSAGKLIGLDGVESAQIIARFERGFSIINAIDNVQRMTNKDSVYGKGGIFGTRPMEFHHTDGGYAGSQNHNLVKTEFGHIWVDAAAGQIFLVVLGGNGMPNLQEISRRYGEEDVKMAMWFKNHLPFKILKSGLDVDIDNSFNGVGLAMEYDSRYKRYLLTKRDYILKNKTLCYRDKNFRATEGIDVQTLIDTNQVDGWEYEGIEDCRLKFSKDVEETNLE